MTNAQSRSSLKGRIIAFVIAIVVVIAAIVGVVVARAQSGSSADSASSASGSSSSQSGKKSTNSNGSRRILVVYFSRTQGVYGGPLKVGNTKRLADFIRDDTGADEYEIVPAKAYPNDYDATTRVAQREQEQNARPAIKNPLPDVSKYDTVFVGAPVWWGEYPMIVRTFMDKVNLNGKTVVPFDTNEGSGMANFKEQLQSQYPRANVLDGLAVSGNDAAGAHGQVTAWLRQIGVLK